MCDDDMGHTHQECVPQHPCHICGMGTLLVHYPATPLSWLQMGLTRWGPMTMRVTAHHIHGIGAVMMEVAANKVSRGDDDGGGCSPHTWHGCCAPSLCAYTVVLAANKVSKVGGAMMMGVAAHHSPLPVPHLWYGCSTCSSAYLLSHWCAAWVTWQWDGNKCVATRGMAMRRLEHGWHHCQHCEMLVVVVVRDRWWWWWWEEMDGHASNSKHDNMGCNVWTSW